jgi:flagellar hook protein FlgE
MMRALYSGVTGLTNHQTRMDVIGNNIANVNTVGYKGSRVIFQDIYSANIKPASAATGQKAGTNPQQVGLGVQIAAIDVLHSKGAPQYTGESLDFSIDGTGYFILEDGDNELYTRAGNFYMSVDNQLVSANGQYVMGYIPQVDPATGDPILDGDGNQVEVLGRIEIDPSYYDVTIDGNGLVSGVDATGTRTNIATVALANFSNPSGLEKNGENTYVKTNNSGTPVYVKPGEGGSGELKPGTLEMSNVDLADEFTNMIVTQRGFQANSRIITTSDSMLEELVNLKR